MTMIERDGSHIAQVVVGATIGLALVVFTYVILGPKWGAVATAYWLYEAWALINKYRNDTLSEGIWFLSERPVVPLLFGLAVGWGITSGFIHGEWLTLAIGILLGHFFFQPKHNGAK